MDERQIRLKKKEKLIENVQHIFGYNTMFGMNLGHKKNY